MKKILIVGLGLIGGSISRALSLTGKYNICAIDKNAEVIKKALNYKAINKEADDNDIKTADIIYLCLYPDAAIKFINDNIESFSDKVIITDVCGIKEEFCAEIRALKARKDFIFVGGHPMAGKEENGFDVSSSSLFKGASYIIIDENTPEFAVDEISALAMEMGFGGIVKTTAKKHDEIIAFTSQLPHVLACAYVMSPKAREHRGFSAGSYRDVSRVAKINGELWAKLFIENKENLVDELNLLIENISKIRNAVDSADIKEVESLLNTAAAIKGEIG